MINFSIIVPVFQEYNIFQIFWNSLIKTVKYPAKIYIINDASPHDTTEYIHQIKDLPLIKVTKIEHLHSEGSVKCINEALPKVSGDYVVFMDSDIILVDGWQDSIIQVLSNKSIGGMGCILMYPQTGGIQSCGITYTEATGRHLFLNNLPSVLDGKGLYEVQSTVFAFFATRKDITQQLGLLDENFFNGYEDVDYQFRLRTKLQKKIVINPKLRMYHWEQSNGILRNYNRRSNIAYLWKKQGAVFYADLWQYIFEQLEKLSPDSRNYIGVDLCSARLDAESFWMKMQETSSVTIKRTDYYYYNVSEDKNILLPQILPYDYFRIESPVLFLCDHFIKLLDNQYWLIFREKYCRGHRGGCRDQFRYDRRLGQFRAHQSGRCD